MSALVLAAGIVGWKRKHPELEEDRVCGFGYGLPTRYVERYCMSTSPAEGADLILRTDVRQELLAGITPTQPGRTVISGHHVTYRVGWQRGRSDIDVTTQLTARQRNYWLKPIRTRRTAAFPRGPG